MKVQKVQIQCWPVCTWHESPGQVFLRKKKKKKDQKIKGGVDGSFILGA